MTDQDAQADVSSAGALLREARSRKGMTVAEIAAELHLDIAMVEALEADDAERLPAPIFVRGYIKSYARRVGLDEHQVLNAYQPPVVEEPVEAEPPKKAAVSIPLGEVFGVLIVLVRKLILLAVLAGIGWGLYQGYQYWQQRTESSGEDAGQQGLVLPGTEPAKPADDSAITLPVQPSLSPAPPVTEPVPQAEPVEPSVPVTPTPRAEPEIARPAPEPVVPQPAAAEQVDVVLRYGADSWTDIRDADGNKLVFGLIKAGATRSFSATPPLEFVIGNAADVDVEIDGRPFDHSGKIRNNVARFRIDN